MKRMFAFTLAAALLCLLSLAVIIYAHGQLTARGEDVAVTETTLFGDKKEAEGIEAVIALENKGLSWELAYTPAPTVTAKVDFSSDASAYNTADTDEPCIALTELHSGKSTWDEHNTFDFVHDLEALSLSNVPDETTQKLLRNAVSETGVGETLRKKVSLSELYRYFPVRIDYWPPSEGEFQIIDPSDFFKLGVPDLSVTVRMKKDGDGKVTSASLDWENAFLMYTYLIDDENCYIALSGITDAEGNLLASPEGGRPILCRIPQIGASKKTAKLYLNQSVVSSDLSRNAHVLDLRESLDGKTLLLLTEEDGSYCLTSFSKETLRATAKNVLCPAVDYTYNAYDTTLRLLVGEDFLLLLTRSGDFYALKAEENAYNLFLTGNLLPFSGEDGEMESLDKVSAGFDGERLAFITRSPRGEEDYIQGTVLQVFDQSGLLYAGKYRNSLDALQPPALKGYGMSPKAVTFTKEKEASK